jgi:hypothetical protein
LADKANDLKISYKELTDYSTAFGDKFVANIIGNSSTDKLNFFTRDEILKDIVNHKNDIYFDIFVNKTKREQIPTFLFSYFVSYTLPYFTKFYSPRYVGLKDSDSDVVKKIKALQFLEFYIKEGNYMEAYKYVKYLQNEMRYLTSLNAKLSQMAKNELLVDLLDRHINI